MIARTGILFLIIALAATGAFAKTYDPNEPKDYSNDYENTASHRGTPIITEDFEGAFPPAGWTVIDNGLPGPGDGDAHFWGNIAQCGEAGNWTNGSGEAACVSTDIAGSGCEVDTELITSAYDFSAESGLVLAFTANYINLVSTEFFDVDYTLDGGTNWTNILSWNEDHGTFRGTPGEDVALDMSGADGASSVQVRYYHYDTGSNDWDWYVQVDDMVIESTGGGDGGGAVPATTGIGIALMVMALAGGGAYFLRRRS